MLFLSKSKTTLTFSDNKILWPGTILKASRVSLQSHGISDAMRRSV